MIDLKVKLTGIHSEKDIYSRVTKCNAVFLKYAGAQSDDQILGRTDLDFPWYDYAELYRQHESDALIENNYSCIIPFKIYNGETQLFLHTKIAKKDTDGNVNGIICHAIEVINADLSQLIRTLETHTAPIRQPVYTIGKKLPQALSYRQKEILFYLTKGKSAKSIAVVTGLKVRTIEYYIDILKAKLNCQNKAELILYAVESGFNRALPSQDSAGQLRKKISIR